MEQEKLKPSVDMITARGHFVDFRFPNLTEIDLEDLRIHSTNICRYNGALEWRLVQHSALCAGLLNVYRDYTFPDNIRLTSRERIIQKAYAGIHDLHEIYVGDMVNGLKKYVPEYCDIEYQWENRVHDSFRLPMIFKEPKVIKFIDHRALVIEMTRLQHPGAERVQSQLGGRPSNKEVDLFKDIDSIDYNSAWVQIIDAVTEAQDIFRLEKSLKNMWRNK